MKNKGVLLILLSAFGYGLMPIFTRIALNNNASIYEILFTRFTISTVLFLFYLGIKGKLGMLAVPKKTMYKLILLGGILFGFTSITLYSAVYYLTPSMAEILYFTYPGVVMVISIILYKEKINKKKVSSLLLLFIGVVLIINMKGIKVNAIGVFLALSCSLIYSCYIIYIKNKDIQSIDCLIVSFYVMLYANLTFVIFGLLTNSFNFKITFLGYSAIFAIAIFSTLIGLTAFIFGSKYLESSEIAVIATFEPVVTVAADALILHQKIGFRMGIGIIMILMSILILSINVKEKRLC
jgi:drug/metabolite transporter (DMT)-like permease